MKRNGWHTVQHSRSNRRRLLVESLEERAVPAAYVVTTLDSTIADDGQLSLREALEAANTNAAVMVGATVVAPAGDADGDVITFADALGSGTITLGSELTISDDVTIDGSTAAGRRITLSGNDAVRVFNVSVGDSPGTTDVVTLRDLVITRGRAGGASDHGGGILQRNDSTLTLDHVEVSSSRAERGGGIYVQDASTLNIHRSTIRDNQNVGGGAAGLDFGGLMATISDSTFSENRADTDAGGLRVSGGSTITLRNSTISGNTSNANGGGLLVLPGATAHVLFSTIASNTANADNTGVGNGGGIHASVGGTVNLTHSIVADNLVGTGGASPDTFGAFNNVNFSLIEDTGGTTFAGTFTNNITTEDPQLGALADNGGPTLTHLPAATSPAVNAGDPAFTPPPTTDQRGLARVTGGRIDMGAVERSPLVALAAGNVAGLVAAVGAPETTQIDLAAGTYTLTEIDNFWYGPNALPEISRTLTINGNGAVLERDAALANDTLHAFRFFHVSGGLSGLPAGNLTLRELTLRNGLARGGDSDEGGGGLGAGGAVFSQGDLTLDRVTLTANTARGGSGGVAMPGFEAGGGGMGQDAQRINGGGFGGALPGGPFGGSGAGGAGDIGGGGGGFRPSDDASGRTGGGTGGLGGGGPGDGGTGGTHPGDPGAPGGNFGQGGGGAIAGSSDEPSAGGGGVGGGGGGADGGGMGGGGFGGGGGGGNGGGAGGFGGGGGTGGPGGFGGGAGFETGGGGGGFGGAVFNHEGTLTVLNSTLSGNSARGGNGSTAGRGLGGAIFNLNGQVTVLHSTLANNTVLSGAGGAPAAPDGGAVYSLSFGTDLLKTPAADPVAATLMLRNSILADSPGAGVRDLVTDQQAGTHTLTPDRPNLVESSQVGGTVAPGDIPFLAADPQLGLLANNGGLTDTHLPGAMSPAAHAGDPAFAPPPATDQRGQARVQGGRLDLGAVETAIAPPLNLPTATAPTPPPRVQAIRHTGFDQAQGVLTFQVTFDRAVTGVERTDFKLLRRGVSARVLSVSGSGAEYQVRVKLLGGQGRLRLRLRDNNSIADGTGVLLGGPALDDGNFLGPLLRVRSLFTGLFEVGLAVTRKR